MSSRPARTVAIAVGAAFVVAVGAAAAEYALDRDAVRQQAEVATGGNVERGEAAFARYGCGGCHTLRFVPQAQGKVGPPLTGIAQRAVIGGKLANNSVNLRLWIEHPQQVTPGTAMPDLGVDSADARDLAAFLYSRS